MSINFPTLSYGFAALSYTGLAILLLTKWRGRVHASLLAVVAIVASIWGLGLAFEAYSPRISAFQVFLLEVVHDGAWLVFLCALLSGAVGHSFLWIVRYGGLLVVAGALLVGIALQIAANFGWQTADSSQVLVAASPMISIAVLVAIEQIYRNARQSQRQSLKFLYLGIGGIFAYDLYLYSNAILAREISSLLWGVRGLVVFMCVPLIAVAIQRSPSRSVGFFVSRQIALYTATLVGAAIYLAVIVFAAYHVRVVGGNWGPAAQLVFFFAACLVLFVILFSDRSRARLRVFIIKHFFENKYDYRDEWLRLIATLTSPEDELPLKKRGIKALAQIVDAPSGLLWLKSVDGGNYHCVANWNVSATQSIINGKHSLVRFMERTGWVIDLSEFAANPGHYDSLDLEGVSFGVDEAALITPLQHDNDLFGFVILSSSKPGTPLNFEDHDLLKTAGQQIGSYMAQEQSTEKLAENRQFQAFNRLTAYIMHDLKNLIAQQSLVVENAQKHKSNPVFIDDAVETIRGSVARMRRVLDQLRQSSADHPVQKIDLGKLVMQAVSHCADHKPVPTADIGDEQVWVRADRDRLLMALHHGIRNAQDATPAGGQVTVELIAADSECTVSIVDTGRGMDDDFIRDRLFTPFDSTKGAQGMGIGAYQIRETLRSAGGEVHVESAPNHGTKLILRLGVAV